MSTKQPHEETAHHPAPTGEHRKLQVFVGVWKTEGQVRATQGSAAARFQATDTYEWLPGEFFLVHRWHARMPDGDSQGIEILGYDDASRTYFMHSFDNFGTVGVMEGVADGDRWTFTGQLLRFRGGFEDGGDVLTGTWEQRSAGGERWVPWMDVTLRKVNLRRAS